MVAHQALVTSRSSGTNAKDSKVSSEKRRSANSNSRGDANENTRRGKAKVATGVALNLNKLVF